MRLMRYFARYYAGALLLTLFGLVVLMVTVTLVENIDRLAGADEQAGRVALRLIYYSAAEYAVQVLPVAALIGAVVAGTQMARRGELLAAQAAGMTTARVWLAFLGVALVAVVAGCAFGEYVVPRAIKSAAQAAHAESGRADATASFFDQPAQWFREGDTLLYLPSVDVTSGRFVEPVVYVLRQGLISEVIEARALYFVAAKGWQLENAKIFSVATAEVALSPLLPVALKVTPRDLMDIAGNPRGMSMREIIDLARRRVQAGFDATQHKVELFSRVGFPLAGFWMVVLALPWTLNPDRRRSLAVTLGGAVVYVAVQLAVMQLLRVLALGHKIPAFVGAWGGVLFCVALLPLNWGLFRRYRRRGAIF